MQEKLKQIAERIRELREIFGADVEGLSAALHIPSETVREYESGAVDIPVGVLFEISQHFGVELTSLLTGEEPRLHTYALSRGGAGVAVDRRKDYTYQSLAYNFADKKAEPFLVTVDPRPDDSPDHLNSHPGQEFDYVLEGTLQITHGKHVLVLQAGDSLYFDSGVMHGMKALNGRAAKFLAVVF
jgi:quercetin dioxygenase-like cupin family protein